MAGYSYPTYAPSALPATYTHSEPSCHRCIRCHPGKAYPASFCHNNNCGCHRST